MLTVSARNNIMANTVKINRKRNKITAILNAPRTGGNIYYSRCCAKRKIRFNDKSYAKVQRDEKINGNQKYFFVSNVGVCCKYGDSFLFAKICL
jgi:hypothetical protein